MRKILASFLCLFSLAGSVYGDLFSHLKPLPSKRPASTLQGIDMVYMINLDQRPEKWARSIEQLLPYRIEPLRFSAINGWTLPLEVLDEVGLVCAPGMQKGDLVSVYRDEGLEDARFEIEGQTYFSHGLSRGAIGCALSHLSVLQDAWDQGYETVWVMEDDIDVLEDPRTIVDWIQKLDQVTQRDWDILFTDLDYRNAQGTYVPCYGETSRPDFVMKDPKVYWEKTLVARKFWRIRARFGAHSMIIRRSGLEKLLRHFAKHQIFLPYDIEYFLDTSLKLYTTTRDVVGNSTTIISDNLHPTY